MRKRGKTEDLPGGLEHTSSTLQNSRFSPTIGHSCSEALNFAVYTGSMTTCTLCSPASSPGNRAFTPRWTKCTWHLIKRRTANQFLTGVPAHRRQPILSLLQTAHRRQLTGVRNILDASASWHVQMISCISQNSMFRAVGMNDWSLTTGRWKCLNSFPIAIWV